MTDEEFNHIVNQGALSHPLPQFQFMGVLMALRDLIENVPGAEDRFLAHCAAREREDEAGEEPLDHQEGP